MYPLISIFFGLCKTTKSTPVMSSSPIVSGTEFGKAFSIAKIYYINIVLIRL